MDIDMGELRDELDEIDSRERTLRALYEHVAECYMRRAPIAIERFPASSADRQVAMAWCPYHEFADGLRAHMRDHYPHAVLDHVRLFGYVDYIYGGGALRGRCRHGYPPSVVRLAR